jgi:hypothetical protein
MSTALASFIDVRQVRRNTARSFAGLMPFHRADVFQQASLASSRRSCQTLGIAMSSCEFSANCVVTKHPDGACHLVGFADAEFDTQLYLMLQRSFEDEQQDIQLGHDTYHVEWCDQGRSGYGGIDRFVLKRNFVEVIFSPDMAKTLGGLELLRIAIQMNGEARQALEAALSTVFRGSTCVEVVDA